MNKVSQRNVERALRAAMKTGVAVGHFEVRPNGTVAVYAQGQEPEPVNALDDELEQWRKSHGNH